MARDFEGDQFAAITSTTLGRSGRGILAGVLAVCLIGVVGVAEAATPDLASVLIEIDKARDAVRAHSVLEWIRPAASPQSTMWIMAYEGDKAYAVQYVGHDPIIGREAAIMVSDGKYVVYKERLGLSMPFGAKYAREGKADGGGTSSLLAPCYRLHSLLFASHPERWVGDVIRNGRFVVGPQRQDGQIELVEHVGSAGHRILVDPKKGYIVTDDREERRVGSQLVVGESKVLRTMLVNGIYYPIDRKTQTTVTQPGKPPRVRGMELKTTNLTPKIPQGLFTVFKEGDTVNLNGDFYRVAKGARLIKMESQPTPGDGRENIVKLGIALLAVLTLGGFYLLAARCGTRSAEDQSGVRRL